MKTVNAQTITETIAHLCIDANRNLPKDVAAALHQAEETEPFAPAKDLLSLLTKNEQIARTTQMPICQDTGMAVVFADVGQDVHIAGDFAEAVNEGVRRGYVEGLLRKSVVGDPLRRVNTGDNTPRRPPYAPCAGRYADADRRAQGLREREYEPIADAHARQRD